ncbi:MAG: PD-(D/E)XK motif protein [Actinomycetota bacterium]|nr:PD-(D/E)XK motif protein [Actinomycetota bacterium]
MFLFSLRVVRDQLARNTLPALVDQVDSDISAHVAARDDFSRKLGTRGYSPAFRRQHETPYRVLGEALYRVDPGFPRLTAASFADGVPNGITTVSYVIEMATCDPWLVATSPGAAS